MGIVVRFALAVIAFACAAGAIAQTTTVRFGSVGGATDAGLYLAEELGFFKEAGLSVEMQRIPNAPGLTTAIATNQLDVAGISVTPGLYTAVQQSLNLRIVGDKQSIRAGFSATRVVARPELVRGTEAETVQGLKGRKIAITARASSVYLFLERLLAKHGLKLTDVQIVELAYPNMLAALSSGAVDAALSLEPFLSQAVQAGVAKVVHDLMEFVPAGGAVTVPLVYSENFAKSPAAQRFMTAYVKGVRVYNDAFGKGQDKERVIELIAKRGKIDPKVIRGGFPAGLGPDQEVSLAGLEAFQKFFVEQGFIRTPIDVNRIVDTSFAREAVRQLGPYR